MQTAQQSSEAQTQHVLKRLKQRDALLIDGLGDLAVRG